MVNLLQSCEPSALQIPEDLLDELSFLLQRFELVLKHTLLRRHGALLSGAAVKRPHPVLLFAVPSESSVLSRRSP